MFVLGCVCVLDAVTVHVFLSLPSGSGPGELGVNRSLLPVLRAALRDGGHPRVVGYGCVHGPLTGAAHVAESRVQPGALPRPRVAVVGGGGGASPLVVGVLVLLRPGDGWVGGRGAVVLQVEGGVGDVLWGALLLAVVARAQLLCLDLGPVLGLSCFGASAVPQGGQSVLLSLLGLAFRHPGWATPCLRAEWGATADAVAAGVADWSGIARATGRTRVAVRWEVLVKLVDVEGLDVGDHVAAQLADVHVAEIDVELACSGTIGQRAEAHLTL